MEKNSKDKKKECSSSLSSNDDRCSSSTSSYENVGSKSSSWSLQSDQKKDSMPSKGDEHNGYSSDDSRVNSSCFSCGIHCKKK